METHLLSASRGFSQAMVNLNTLGSDSPSELEVLCGTVFKSEWQGTVLSATHEDRRNMSNALCHICRGCIEHKIENPALRSALAISTEASQNTIEAILIKS
jgi:hypothetical protein